MSLLIWIGFLLLIGALVAFDLGVLNKHSHTPSPSQALGWTAVWVSLAIGFGGVVYYLYSDPKFDTAQPTFHESEISAAPRDAPPDPHAHRPELRLTGGEAATQYFTAYLVEEALSIDNIFVIAMVFAYFGVPTKDQHRVLFWGILGAVVLRGVMILTGAALLHRFEWVMYIFGALLIFSAIKLLLVDSDDFDAETNFIVRLVRRWFPVTSEFHGNKFFVKQNGRTAVTPLFLALVMVETTDVMFAIDSIPAVFGVTRDPFIVFTSNIFAILGLRSLYFVLAGFMDQFQHIKTSLVFVLAFVGAKMLLKDVWAPSNQTSLLVIVTLLSLGVLASLLFPHRAQSPHYAGPAGEGAENENGPAESAHPEAPSMPVPGKPSNPG